MRCSRSRALLFERELGPLSPVLQDALRSHLAGCATCSNYAGVEQRLSADLAALRVQVPFPVDVTARVARGLDVLDARPRGDVSVRQLGWGAGLAAAASLPVLAGVWSAVPQLWGAAREGWTLAGVMGRLLTTLVGAATVLLSAAARAGAEIVEPLAPLLSALRGLEPIVIATLTLCAAVVAGTVVLVVGRDLRGAAGSGWIRKEG